MSDKKPLSERELAYKRLRTAAHHLICNSQVMTRGGYVVRQSLMQALNKALDQADAFESPKSSDKEEQK